MLPYQKMLVDWIAHESALTGLLVLAAGLLSGLYGHRMIRFLLVIYCGGIGFAGGYVGAELAGYPPVVVGSCAAGVAAGLGLALPQPGTVFASMGLWTILAAYATTQMNLDVMWTRIVISLTTLASLVMTVLCRTTMTILLTAFHGAVLFILGLIGVGMTCMPVVGNTFREWTSGRSVIVPVLLLMLVATSFSYQANDRQGDARVGTGGGDLRNRLRASAR